MTNIFIYLGMFKYIKNKSCKPDIFNEVNDKEPSITILRKARTVFRSIRCADEKGNNKCIAN